MFERMNGANRMRHHLAVALLGCGLSAASHAAVPGEVANLTWCPGSTACLQWDAVPGATSYAVYRGDGVDLSGLTAVGAPGTADAALAGSWPGTSTGPMLVGEPSAGAVYWYLAAARNADGEGGPGVDGDLLPRLLDPAGTSCGDLAYIEDFDGTPDGDPWPAPWAEAGVSVDVADVQAGQARFRPLVSNYSLGRMVAPLAEADVEVTFAVEFEDVATEGVGFYVRSNGGYLTQTAPPGQGYAVFVEGFRTDPGIGVWREILGSEQPIEILFDPALDLQDGVRYRVRFRAVQADPSTTSLRARLWPEGAPEPGFWHVDVVDQTPELQGSAGAIALDSWSTATPGTFTPQHASVDDVAVRRLCAEP